MLEQRNDVSGQNAEVSSPTTWASGDFSSSDYDNSVVSTGSWVDGYEEVATIDVTDVIANIYDNNINYGMAIFADASITGRASEYGTGKPSLEISYHYESIGDTTPTAFTFTDVTDATISTVYTSNAITVAGINTDATIAITAGTGEYELNNSGTWTSLRGSLNDTVKLGKLHQQATAPKLI